MIDQGLAKLMDNILEMPNLERSQSADILICDCYRVKASTILRIINEGGAQVGDEIVRQTCAGNGCGSCQCRIQRLLSGLPAECGPCALCPGCGYVKTLCNCQAA